MYFRCYLNENNFHSMRSDVRAVYDLEEKIEAGFWKRPRKNLPIPLYIYIILKSFSFISNKFELASVGNFLNLLCFYQNSVGRLTNLVFFPLIGSTLKELRLFKM